MNIYAVSVKKPSGDKVIRFTKAGSTKELRKRVLSKLEGTPYKLEHIEFCFPTLPIDYDEPYKRYNKKLKKTIDKYNKV